MRSSKREVYAALDLGTNNCRLLIAVPAAEGFRVIDAFSRIVRLGEGLGVSGRLSEAAMARTLEALQICAAKMRRRGVTQVRAVATEACRRAANCDAFLDRVARETGIELEIIANNEEANRLLSRIGMGLEYLLFRRGPLTMAPSQFGAFAKSDPGRETPNLQYHIQPLSTGRPAAFTLKEPRAMMSPLSSRIQPA